MYIERFILRHMKMRLLHPFITSFGTIHDKEFILVEAIDHEGTSGWAESVAFTEPYYNEETMRTNWHMIEDFLIPLALRFEFNHPDELRSRFCGVRGNYMAKSAVEGACWDLYAKRQGVPLATAIGGRRQHVEAGVSIGIKDSPDQLLEVIDDNVSKGYKRIKIKIKPGWDVGIVSKVRERFPHVQLMVDANSAYSLSDLDHLKQLDAFRLMMIEQPLAYDDMIDHSELQKHLETPICLDESIHSSEDARRAIQLGSCRVINIKIGRVGGISSSIAVHNFCQEHQIPVWCGGMFESGIGRAHNIAIASLANFTLPGDIAASDNYWEEDIIEPEVTVHNGLIKVPTSPGIGYIPNMNKINDRTMYEQTYR